MLVCGWLFSCFVLILLCLLCGVFVCGLRFCCFRLCFVIFVWFWVVIVWIYCGVYFMWVGVMLETGAFVRFVLFCLFSLICGWVFCALLFCAFWVVWCFGFVFVRVTLWFAYFDCFGCGVATGRDLCCLLLCWWFGVLLCGLPR